MISNVFLLLARALTSVHRVSEVLDEKPAIESASDAIDVVPSGSVEFRDVSFRYRASAREDVLEHISLSFAAGITVGVLGGTGAGKTSLVQLIPRLYDVSAGSVFVGGHVLSRLHHRLMIPYGETRPVTGGDQSNNGRIAVAVDGVPVRWSLLPVAHQ